MVEIAGALWCGVTREDDYTLIGGKSILIVGYVLAELTQVYLLHDVMSNRLGW